MSFWFLTVHIWLYLSGNIHHFETAKYPELQFLCIFLFYCLWPRRSLLTGKKKKDTWWRKAILKKKSHRPCLFRKHLHQIQTWVHPKLTCYIWLIIEEKKGVSNSKNTAVHMLLTVNIQKLLGLFESFAFSFAKNVTYSRAAGCRLLSQACSVFTEFKF